MAEETTSIDLAEFAELCGYVRDGHDPFGKDSRVARIIGALPGLLESQRSEIELLRSRLLVLESGQRFGPRFGK